MNSIGVEVVVINDDGNDADRIVYTLREGPILHRLQLVNEMRQIAKDNNFQVWIYCKGTEFNRLMVTSDDEREIDKFLKHLTFPRFRKMLVDYDIEGCKLTDKIHSRQIAIPGRPMRNF